MPVVGAVTETFEKMNIGDTAKVNGKTFTILDVNVNQDFLVKVDGVRGILKYDFTEEINGMIITIENVTYIDYDYVLARIKIRVDQKCGDSLCNKTESELICCTDCGCEEGYGCVDNICTEISCNNDAECDDDNACTKDVCSTAEKGCENLNILTCENDDGCCPESCIYNLDNDCPKPEVEESESEEVECGLDEECVDKNPCTEDKCLENKCSYRMKDGCAYNGECLPISKRIEDKYCGKNGWVDLNEDHAACLVDYECKIGQCIKGLCGGVDKEKRNGIITMAAVMVLVAAIVIYYNRSSKRREIKEEKSAVKTKKKKSSK